MNDPLRDPMQEEGCYCCTACGEQIVIPLDISAGNPQEYIEDCPVCCRPNILRVFWSNGISEVVAEAES